MWGRENSEAVELWIDLSLFADDTLVERGEDEIENGVRTTKKVTGEFEERNNDDNVESLEFGMEGSGKIRMLGC